MSKVVTSRAKGPRKMVTGTDLGFSWGLWNSLLLGLGIVILVLGYVTLSRGSTTLAPVLLVAGYCVVIPASLLARTRNRPSGE